MSLQNSSLKINIIHRLPINPQQTLDNSKQVGQANKLKLSRVLKYQQMVQYNGRKINHSNYKVFIFLLLYFVGYEKLQYQTADLFQLHYNNTAYFLVGCDKCVIFVCFLLSILALSMTLFHTNYCVNRIYSFLLCQERIPPFELYSVLSTKL